MDKMRIIKYNNEEQELISFLTSQEWPFHEVQTESEEHVKELIKEGYFSKEGVETFWIETGKKIGFIRIFDLDDGTPLFDIRISGYRVTREVKVSALKQ